MAANNGTTIVNELKDDSTGQVLASGSQDVAALAGLFCTDGVERNALASEYGYMTVITSALSILGILGLVKSSVKLALGLEKCLTSGWSPDSLRGIFGYTIKESPRSTGEVIDCLRVSVYRDKDDLVLEKERQRFDEDKVPILAGGWNEATNYPYFGPLTVVNLGNMIREREFAQSPIIMGTITFLCAGVTSWVLILVSLDEEQRWHWTVYVATIGLHMSLIIMLVPALWHAYRTARPSLYLNGEIWNFLTRSQPDAKHIPRKFTFMRTCKKAKGGYHQVLHFRGDVSYLQELWFKALLLSASALCTVSYICQYTVLKSASSTRSAVWIGVQAGLALLRLLIWLLDPPFDDPRTRHAEYITLDNLEFPDLSLIRILTDFMGDGRQDFVDNPRLTDTKRRLKIPVWAWEYLQSTSLGQILEDSKLTDDSELPEPFPFKDQACNSTASSSRSLAGMQAEFDTSRKDAILGRDRLAFETNLTRLLRRHADFLDMINLNVGASDSGIPSLRLVLVLSEQEKTTEPRVTPLLTLQMKESAADVDGRQVRQPVILDSDSLMEHAQNEEEFAKHFRFAGNPGGHWLMLPTKSDLDQIRGKKIPLANVYEWSKFTVQFKEIPIGEPDVTHINIAFLPLSEHDVDKSALSCLQKFFDTDWLDLPESAQVEDHSIVFDLRNVPLPRSWKLWKNIRQTKPGVWISESQELFQDNKKERTTCYEMKFQSSQDCLAFAGRYVDFDAELDSIMWLKRAMKVGHLIDKIPWLKDFWEGSLKWTWQGLAAKMEERLELMRSDIYDYPLGRDLVLMKWPT
ncbi:MAG: hypothetical protein Q9159_003168 [Coniocarpon cinnabarinum]